MKLLVLNRSRNDYAKGRFLSEARNLGIEANVINYSHLHIFLKEGRLSVTAMDGQNLEDFDLMVVRSPGLTNRYTWQERVIIEWMHGYGKRVLNYDSLTTYPGEFDKLLQTHIFLKNGIPFVETHSLGTSTFLEQNVLTYPFILKRTMGSLGRDFIVVRSKVQLDEFLRDKSLFEFIAQPFLPTGADFRVIVLGGQVLGAMKRSTDSPDKPTNAAAGGRVEKAELTPKLEELALRAAKSLSCEFCGVDIMHDLEGTAYVLEVNRYSVFKEFEKVTGVNVAGKIIEYLIATVKNDGKS